MVTSILCLPLPLFSGAILSGRSATVVVVVVVTVVVAVVVVVAAAAAAIRTGCLEATAGGRLRRAEPQRLVKVHDRHLISVLRLRQHVQHTL
eukprot:COSAG01_NODE_7360_length_3237_cov_1.253346_5_plen_92_part_00